MRYYLIVTLTVLSVLFASGLAMAQQYNHGSGMMGSGMMGSGMMGTGMMGTLSAEKQATLNTLRVEHNKKITPLVLEFRAKQAEIDSLLVAPKLDKNKISAVNRQINDLYGKISLEKNNFRRDVFELTGYIMGGYGSGMGGMKGKGMGCGGSKSMMKMMMPSQIQSQ